jgi:predicted RNA-binding Zn-ribbon protein involved in translation (DUF1610 family)
MRVDPISCGNDLPLRQQEQHFGNLCPVAGKALIGQGTGLIQ